MMRIGFDAKRAFQNKSGLGNYSRFIINALCSQFPENEYLLYTPSLKKSFHYHLPDNAALALPQSAWSKQLKNYWRSVGLTSRLEKDKIDIYHGLSNELPLNINKSKVKRLVTIHDLIFLRLPHLYKPIDRKIYLTKTRTAIDSADKIIAISQQTREDLVDLLQADPKKIELIYQGCHPWFYEAASDQTLINVRDRYELPASYLLYVGTIEARKNLLKIIKALYEGKIETPLLVIGRKTAYYKEVLSYIEARKMKNIYFHDYVPNIDLPAIYQMATAFIYPSAYEGFGIPVLEALNSGIPVITSSGGCLEETMGPGGLAVNPETEGALASAISRVINETELRKELIELGTAHALNFREEKTIPQLMELYKNCML